MKKNKQNENLLNNTMRDYERLSDQYAKNSAATTITKMLKRAKTN